MKMEPIVSSETSAIRTQTPGNYPKRNNLHLEHGESLRTRLTHIFTAVLKSFVKAAIIMAYNASFSWYYIKWYSPFPVVGATNSQKPQMWHFDIFRVSRLT